MAKLSTSFDSLLLQDELLASLRQSPLTSQLVPLRAEQIIQIVVQKPICLLLEAQLRALQLRLDEEKRNKKTLRSDSKRERSQKDRQSREKDDILRQQNDDVQHYLQDIDQLQQQNSQLRAQLEHCQLNAQELSKANGGLQAGNGRLTEQVQGLKLANGQLHRQIEERAGTIAQTGQAFAEKLDKLQTSLKQTQEGGQRELQQQLGLLHRIESEHESELRQRDRQVQLLKEERFDLKNQLNSLKIDTEELVSGMDTLSRQNQELQGDRDKAKEAVRANRMVHEKEKKMITNRLYELSATYKAHQQLKAALKPLCRKVKQLKASNSRNSDWMKEQIRTLNHEVTQNTQAMLDEVGKQVGLELRALEEKLQRRGEEAKEARLEAKAREEVLERLERQMVSGNREISQLKSQLRGKRREEQRLRRELRASYEESETKLSELQKKYLALLGTSGY